MMHLNSAQRAAIEQIAGPCLVIAGAGSGKTGVIVQKIVRLLRTQTYAPSQIAAITFTNKAAREMKVRLASLIEGAYSENLTIATFHALGLRILRQEHHALGMRSKLCLFDEHDQLQLLAQLTEKEAHYDKPGLLQLASYISRWKSALTLPDMAEKIGPSIAIKEAAHWYRVYVRHTRACSIVDFDDLILLPVVLFRENSMIRERWRESLRYFLVDEYQDTNTAQYEFLKLMVGEAASFTVVGDDDQSIYAWRGAQADNLISLKYDFPELTVIKLEQNYRSSARILRAANALISKNEHFFEKKLFSNLPEGEKIRIVQAEDPDKEAEWVMSDIQRHQFTESTRYHEYAILYRGNYQGDRVEAACMARRVPYHRSGGISFFARTEIKLVLGYLRLLVNPDDDTAFLRIINVPRRGLGSGTVSRLSAWCQQRGVSLLRGCRDFGFQQMLSSSSLAGLQVFIQLFDVWAEQLNELPVATFMEQFLIEIGVQAWVRSEHKDAQVAQSKRHNLERLSLWIIERVLTLEKQAKQEATAERLYNVIVQLTLKDEMGHLNEAPSAIGVQLMTMHAAKGLEFPYVYILGMEEGIVPHATSVLAGQEAEERRLAYVAMTRAKKRVIFTHCATRKAKKTYYPSFPSRFLSEIPPEEVEWTKTTEAKPLSPEMGAKLGQAALSKIRRLYALNQKKEPLK